MNLWVSELTFGVSKSKKLNSIHGYVIHDHKVLPNIKGAIHFLNS